MRRWLALRLHFLADRMAPEDAFRATHLRFTFETGQGIVVRDDSNRGCRLWYRGEADYEKAHADSINPPIRINWNELSGETG